MEKKIKFLILIEVQVILVLIIFGLVKLNTLDKKVYNTNKFISEVIIDNRVEELKHITQDDIVIGVKNAPVTMIMFTRFGCSACQSFYQDTYPQLLSNYVDNGLLNIVVRQMASSSMPKILYASKAALFAYENGFFHEFNSQIHASYPLLDNEFIDETIFQFIGDTSSYRMFTKDDYTEKKLINAAVDARKAGVRGTPSFMIGDTKIHGTRDYKRFEKVINEFLENESCE